MLSCDEIESMYVIKTADKYASTIYSDFQIRENQDKQYYLYEAIAWIEETITAINKSISEAYNDYESCLKSFEYLKNDDCSKSDYDNTINRYAKYNEGENIEFILFHPRVMEKKKTYELFMSRVEEFEKLVETKRKIWEELVEGNKEILSLLNTKYAIYKSILDHSN